MDLIAQLEAEQIAADRPVVRPVRVDADVVPERGSRIGERAAGRSEHVVLDQRPGEPGIEEDGAVERGGAEPVDGRPATTAISNMIAITSG